MALPGEVIENPQNGERVRFIQTAHETGGQSLRFESVMKPGGFVGATHVHPRQTSHFEVLRGCVQFRVGRDHVKLGEGEVLTVLPGTPHRFWNAGAEELCMVIEFRPALKTEALFETFFGLARDGKVSGEIIRNPLQDAVLLDEYFQESRPSKPLPVLRLRRLLAPVGRLFGYRAVYSRYSPAPAEDPRMGESRVAS